MNKRGIDEWVGGGWGGWGAGGWGAGWMDEWYMGVWAEWMLGRVNEFVGGKQTHMDKWEGRVGRWMNG